jgi:hypothetical protein
MFTNILSFSLYNLRDMFTMEETFILTGIFVLLLGTGLGLLCAWLSSKNDEQSDDK